MISRRKFLGMSVLGSAAFLSRLRTFEMMSALASNPSDYRALVCVFLLGGNDSNNMIVPIDASNYASYSSIRQALAIPSASLLPVTPANTGSPLGFHPSMPEMQSLFNSKALGVVANVGTLVQPTTQAQYQQGTVTIPEALQSHLNQQNQWQSGLYGDNQTASGWGGRVSDQLTSMNDGAVTPTALSIAGNSQFGMGVSTLQGAISTGTLSTITGIVGSYSSQRATGFQQLLTNPESANLIQAANAATTNSLAYVTALQQAIGAAPALTTVFPNSTLGTQLQQVAEIIQVRSTLGMSRQIFFCSLATFDTHTNQISAQATMLQEVSQALNAFYQATEALGVASSVTTFTESEFARTFQPNSNSGSDHAWGGHQLVMGGAVNGGKLYGSFPTFELGGPSDASVNGTWIPTTGLDQYAATLAAWFGVPTASLPTIFQYLSNFSTQNLGFV